MSEQEKQGSLRASAPGVQPPAKVPAAGCTESVREAWDAVVATWQYERGDRISVDRRCFIALEKLLDKPAACAACGGSKRERVSGRDGDEIVIPCSVCQPAPPPTHAEPAASTEGHNRSNEEE